MALWKRKHKAQPIPLGSSQPGPPPPHAGSAEQAAGEFVGRFMANVGVQMAGAPPRADTSWRGQTPPPNYLETFLASEDLPGMMMPEDRRLMRTIQEDGEAFPAAGGVVCGLARWAPDEAAEHGMPIERLIDLRWLFADADDALAWHRSRLEQNSEGMPSLSSLGAIGSECHAFGGVQQDPLFSHTFTSFNYLFVVDRVLVKLFLADSSNLGLQEGLAADIAGRAARRAARISTA